MGDREIGRWGDGGYEAENLQMPPLHVSASPPLPLL
jgi:hypothetical protein